jgi:CheY-specific phosphatase CheX
MTSTPKTPNWFDIGMDAWALAAESNMVIAMRIGSLAQGGPAAAQEVRRMVTEKVAANLALGCDLMTGKLGSSPEAIVSGSIAHYSKSVVANRKRLSGTRAAQMPEDGGKPE